MYKSLIRPLLFLLSPETVHHLVVFFIKCLVFIPGMKRLSKYWFSYSGNKLATTVAGLHFSSKVGMAAGFDKNADFYDDFSIFGFSFIEIGTVTPLAQSGNPKPRLFRLPADKALINRMGFNNKGVEFAANNLRKRDKSIIIGGNIGKNTTTPNERASEDYLTCFNTLYDVVDYLVVNVSCPNIAGLDKLQDQDSLREILDILMKARKSRTLRKPVFLKISPDLSFQQIDETIALCHESGLDGIIATNTTKLRKGLSTSEERIAEIGSGGLSGAPLRKRATEIISYICKQTENTLPVIATGGILTPEDAVEMIKAGASLVQVYTGFVYEGPFVVKRINKAIESYYKQL